MTKNQEDEIILINVPIKTVPLEQRQTRVLLAIAWCPNGTVESLTQDFTFQQLSNQEVEFLWSHLNAKTYILRKEMERRELIKRPQVQDEPSQRGRQPVPDDLMDILGDEN